MLTWSLIYYASEWALRIAMLLYVPQRRSAAAARAWLLLIFLFPWLGLVLYSILGRAALPRKRVEQQARASDAIRRIQKQGLLHEHMAAPVLPEHLQQVPKLVERLGDFGVVGGNRFELIDDYQGAIDRMVEDIQKAQRHVHLLYYIFAGDATGLRVVEALERASRRGVACRVLVDGLGSKRGLAVLAPRLRAAGIELTALLPFRIFQRNRTRIDLRNHRKLVIIDGEIGYFGSQNLVDPEFVKGYPNEELVARATGPVVGQLQALFMADRFFERDHILSDPVLFSAGSDAQASSLAQVLPGSPGYKHENVQELLVSLLHRAQSRAVLTTPYFVPDDALLQAMQVSALRGVDVHLVLSRTNNQRLVRMAQASYLEELLESGVHIHLYRPRFLHAKHLTVDRSIAMIGSSNFDIRSFALNAEVSVLIYDEKVVDALTRIQERYFANADELQLDAWRRIPGRQKILQNIARLCDSLL